jgi:hypothetical protein
MLDTAHDTLTEGDYLITAGVLKKAREEAIAKKSGKSNLHVRTKAAPVTIRFHKGDGEIDATIVRQYEKSTSGYITPGNHICEYETTITLAPVGIEPAVIVQPNSFYITMKGYIDLMRPMVVSIDAMGIQQTYRYEKWVETAMQEDLAELKAMEAYKKAGGKDKYEDSDCEIWTGEYGYGRFENFLMNRIQTL